MADFKTTQHNISLSLNIEILKHCASVYTPTMFKVFESECDTYNCGIEICLEVETIIEYKFTHPSKNFDHIVKYYSTNGMVLCSCRKLEFTRILCFHIVKVFSLKNIMTRSSQYVLKKWTKNSKRRVSQSLVCETSTTSKDHKANIGRRFKELYRWHTQLAAKATKSKKRMILPYLILLRF